MSHHAQISPAARVVAPARVATESAGAMPAPRHVATWSEALTALLRSLAAASRLAFRLALLVSFSGTVFRSIERDPRDLPERRTKAGEPGAGARGRVSVRA